MQSKLKRIEKLKVKFMWLPYFMTPTIKFTINDKEYSLSGDHIEVKEKEQELYRGSIHFGIPYRNIVCLYVFGTTYLQVGEKTKLSDDVLERELMVEYSKARRWAEVEPKGPAMLEETIKFLKEQA